MPYPDQSQPPGHWLVKPSSLSVPLPHTGIRQPLLFYLPRCSVLRWRSHGHSKDMVFHCYYTQKRTASFLLHPYRCRNNRTSSRSALVQSLSKSQFPEALLLYHHPGSQLPRQSGKSGRSVVFLHYYSLYTRFSEWKASLTFHSKFHSSDYPLRYETAGGILYDQDRRNSALPPHRSWNPLYPLPLLHSDR